LSARTITLGAAVALSGGIPEYQNTALTVFVALGTARVVIVSPIVATTPLFSLVISLVFLRGKERVTGLTILGTVAVVAGTVAIALGK
jgi:drug/metabolite transporter (DMT)-like permease